MHVQRFLHKTLSSVMHHKRLATLIGLVMSLITWKTLSVTGLGRGLALPIQERSAIRRADRFIGNPLAHEELPDVYAVHVTQVVGSKRKPKIVVDWTQAPNTHFYVLRATLVTKGRAITLYEEVHPETSLSNVKVEKAFLDRLQALLPAECRPIIITDAGFRNPWFMHVVDLAWDYVGRVRGTHTYYKDNQWRACRELVQTATLTPRSEGEVILCKQNSLSSHLYVYKENIKKSRVKKPRGRDGKAYARAAQEGWLLASSLGGRSEGAIKRVIKLYKMRMQIEESFRDLKSSHYGFGLEHAHSRTRARIRILLVIAMFAAWVAWLVGYAAEKRKWQYQFQVNSIKTRRVLSLFYLGCQVIRRGIAMTLDMLECALHEMWVKVG